MDKTKRIEALESTLTRIQARHSARIRKLQEQLQGEYNKLFDQDSELQSALRDLDSSQKYDSDESGIYRWTRFCFHDVPEDAREYLAVYLSDTMLGSVHADFTYDALMVWEGESVVINGDGDIFLSDGSRSKLIIDSREYTEDGEQDEAKRNRLIEAWMDKNGYFPGVFRKDRHGNVFPVNTRETAEVES